MITVFTNGCFDLLHPGHVQLLHFASTLGDRLVVGVNDDESVDRPVLPLAQRMYMLRAIRWVDAVLSFSEDTALPLLRRLNPRPTVLVKGSDWRDREFPERTWAAERGASIVFFERALAVSTTAILGVKL